MKLLYAVAAGLIIVGLVVGTPILSSSKEDFSTYNSEWNGCSRIKELSHSAENRPVRAVFSTNDLVGMDRGVLVMLNPSNSVSTTENDIVNVKTFVQNGGALLLSADTSDTSPLLQGLGLSDRVGFDKGLLRDDMMNWVDSANPQISTFAPSTITTDVHRVYFNYGTVLDITNTSGTPDITVLAKSGPSSYLSAVYNGPAAPSNGSSAPRGEKAVLASVEYGKGTVVLCSDPSVFINGMLDKGDNKRLYENIVANLTRDDATVPIIFDESHRAQQPVGSLIYSQLISSDAAKYAFVLGALGLFLTGMAGVRLTRRTRLDHVDQVEAPLDEATIIDDIAERHPRWNRALLKELLNNLRLNQKRRHP
ncbi:MAG: DUF4350 domain-containing protein [Halobacteriota archaeon]